MCSNKAFDLFFIYKKKVRFTITFIKSFSIIKYSMTLCSVVESSVCNYTRYNSERVHEVSRACQIGRPVLHVPKERRKKRKTNKEKKKKKTKLCTVTEAHRLLFTPSSPPKQPHLRECDVFFFFLHSCFPSRFREYSASSSWRGKTKQKD